MHDPRLLANLDVKGKILVKLEGVGQRLLELGTSVL